MSAAILVFAARAARNAAIREHSVSFSGCSFVEFDHGPRQIGICALEFIQRVDQLLRCLQVLETRRHVYARLAESLPASALGPVRLQARITGVEGNVQSNRQGSFQR